MYAEIIIGDAAIAILDISCVLPAGGTEENTIVVFIPFLFRAYRTQKV